MGVAKWIQILLCKLIHLRNGEFQGTSLYNRKYKGFEYYIKGIPMFHHVGKKLHLSLLEITDTPLNSDFGLTGNEYWENESTEISHSLDDALRNRNFLHVFKICAFKTTFELIPACVHIFENGW